MENERVKALCFHPVKPWLLAGLHRGEMWIMDYETYTGVLRILYNHHPVRGVDFHPTKPMFVSGGDDRIIRFTYYDKSAPTFELTGHTDRIRSVEFHKTLPLVVSASDDYTCRLWNHETREKVAVLKGHNHFCMSARFHPTEPLIVTSNLDQTFRLWNMDGTCKRVFDAHERGINQVSFHPTLPLVVSASDDHTVKVWDLTKPDKTWWVLFSSSPDPVHTFRGHTEFVSCAVFHQNKVISGSEDGYVKFWDMETQECEDTLSHKGARVWALAVHPTKPILAIGDDLGLHLVDL